MKNELEVIVTNQPTEEEKQNILNNIIDYLEKQI